MLIKLAGEVTYNGKGFVIVEREGLGYRVFLPEDAALGAQGKVEYYLHEKVRDDERELFGFPSVASLELFWKLTGVSGVGAKSAQKIVYSGSIDDVRGQIMKGDLGFLTSIPGIGKKTAQKIILELKGALAEDPAVSSMDADAIEGLMGLGYGRKDAEAALSGIEAETTEARIRLALQNLSR